MALQNPTVKRMARYKRRAICKHLIDQGYKPHRARQMALNTPFPDPKPCEVRLQVEYSPTSRQAKRLRCKATRSARLRAAKAA